MSGTSGRAYSRGSARGGIVALAVIGGACWVEPVPRTTVSPSSAPQEVPVAPRVEIAIPRDGAVWGAFAGAAEARLQWAYVRAERGPAARVGDDVVFAAPDGGFVRIDGRTGALRWRGEPGPASWRALAATAEAAVALGGEGRQRQIRWIDLADGRHVDRAVSPAMSVVSAIGSALVVGDRCDLELLGAAGAAVFVARGRAAALAGESRVCAAPAEVVAVTPERALIAHDVDGRARLEWIDRGTGAVVEALAIEAESIATREPITGVVVIREATGRVRLVRAERGVTRAWAGPGAVDVRGVALADGSSLLLARDGQRWTSVEPDTLVDRWTRSSDIPVALFGEVARARGDAREEGPRWLDPRDGSVVSRTPRAPATAIVARGEIVLVMGTAGALATDGPGGAVRWAIPGRVELGAPDGPLVVRAPRSLALGLVDERAGRWLLRTRLRGELVARIGDAGGAVSVVVTAEPAAIVAFSDEDPNGGTLLTDPVAAFAPPCDARHASLAELDRFRGCHLDRARLLVFAADGAQVSRAHARTLDALARRWRSDALQSALVPSVWPWILVRGRRTAREAPELAERRAAAIRDALIERGVPCSAIFAAGEAGVGHAGAEVTEVDALACLL